MVFNRWGEMIFQTSTWGEGWDGTSKGSTEISQIDTYVWKAIVKPMATTEGDKKEYKGIVNLIK